MDDILKAISTMSPEELQEIKDAAIAADGPAIEQAMFDRYGLQRGDHVKYNGELVLWGRRELQPILKVKGFTRNRKRPIVLCDPHHYKIWPENLTKES